MSEPDPATGSRLSQWWSPAGISAIAATLTLVGGPVAGLFTAAVGIGGRAPAPEDLEPAAHTLFVYGTWEPNGSHWEQIRELVGDYSEDAVAGSLYDSGRGYAFATFGGRGTVPGVLLEFDDAGSFGDATDALAKFGTDLFDRAEVETESGQSATAYEWALDPDGYERIGEWEDWREGFGVATALNDLDVGNCFDLTAGQDSAVLVSCESPYQYYAFHRDLFAEGPYPGDEIIAASTDTHCANAHQAHFGEPLPTNWTRWHPSQETWANGDRVFLCALIR